MGPRNKVSYSFKCSVLGVCKTPSDTDYIRRAMRTNDVARVRQFIAEGAKEKIVYFGKNKTLSAGQLLARLESARDNSDVDAIIDGIKDYHAYLQSNGGADECDSDGEDYPDLVANMANWVEASKEEGAHVLLSKDLDVMAIPERMRMCLAVFEQYDDLTFF